MSLLVALASVGGIVYIGSQSKFVPYVVQVDKLGQAAAIAPAQTAAPADKRVIEASVASFIADARLVTPDVALQRKAIFRVYSMLAPNDPGAAKMTEWFSAAEESKPVRTRQARNRQHRNYLRAAADTRYLASRLVRDHPRSPRIVERSAFPNARSGDGLCR